MVKWPQSILNEPMNIILWSHIGCNVTVLQTLYILGGWHPFFHSDFKKLFVCHPSKKSIQLPTLQLIVVVMFIYFYLYRNCHVLYSGPEFNGKETTLMVTCMVECMVNTNGDIHGRITISH